MAPDERAAAYAEYQDALRKLIAVSRAVDELRPRDLRFASASHPGPTFAKALDDQEAAWQAYVRARDAVFRRG